MSIEQPDRKILWDILEYGFDHVDDFDEVPHEQRSSFRFPVGERQIDFINASEIVHGDQNDYWLVRGGSWRCIIRPNGDHVDSYCVSRFKGDKSEFERDLIEARLLYC